MVSRPKCCRVGATACGLAFLTACGDSDPSGPEVIDLADTYDYEFNVSNASGQLICDGEGVVTMSQAAEEFSGTYQGWARCYTPSGDGIVHEGAGQITAGLIDDRAVSFRFTVFTVHCAATGSTPSEPLTSLAGAADCTYTSPFNQDTVDLTGTWQASR